MDGIECNATSEDLIFNIYKKIFKFLNQNYNSLAAIIEFICKIYINLK